METNGKWQNKNTNELLKAILLLDTKKEAEDFLRDLLTEGELVEFSNRWKTVQMLNQGISYKVIEKETRMSSTTIARISKWMRDGRGGYKTMLKKI